MTAASTQRAAEHSAPTDANSPVREETGPGVAALAALCADTSDYRRAATDLEYFGRLPLIHI